jgi:hypothetical protein
MNLTAVAGGLTRQRVKGAARRDTLYDLLNGYVTSEGTIVVRPGTVRSASVPGTKGLTAFAGALHVFAHEVVAVPAGYVLHVLSHPNAEPGDVSGDFAITEIHFAEPFMGFLYVAAEFGNGDVYHFWLQSLGAWQADHIYRAGDLVEPTVPTGIAYRAVRMGGAYPSWAPNVPRADGDFIEPTVYNNYYYEVVETIGASPASGTVEPTWPTTEGAQVVEDIEGVTGLAPGTTIPPFDVPLDAPRYS